MPRAERETLRRLTALAQHHLRLLHDDAGRKETLRSAHDLAEELGAWHRRVEPAAYARLAGLRP